MGWGAFDLGAGVTVTSAVYRDPTRYDLTVDVDRFAPVGAATLRMTNVGGGADAVPNALTLLAQRVDPALKVMVLGDDVAAGLPANPDTDPTFRGPLHDELDGRLYDVEPGWAPGAMVDEGGQRPMAVSFVGGQHGIGAGPAAVESATLADQDHEAHPGYGLADLATFGTGGTISGPLPGWLATHDPDVVVVSAGHEDARTMSAPTTGQAAAAVQRFEPILEAILRHNPYARVVVTDLTPVRSAQAALNARIDAFNAALPAQLGAVIADVLAGHALPAGQVLFEPGHVAIEPIDTVIADGDIEPDAPGVHLNDAGPAQALAAVAAEIADGVADTGHFWSVFGTQRPAPPTAGPTVTPGVTDAVVGWTDPPFNFDAGPVNRYQVVATPAAGGVPVVRDVVLPGAGHDPASAAPRPRSTLLAGLDPATPYRFTVRAVSRRGAGPTSPATTAVTTAAPPSVDAGPDRTVTLPGPAALDGTTTAATSVSWAKVSGPGSVIFSNPGATDTSARFDAVGTYALRLSATNAQGTVSDTVTVTVSASVPAPTPSGGSGYFVLEADGDLYAFGDARPLLAAMDPAAVDVAATATTVSRALAPQLGGAAAVAIERTADDGGLWVLVDDGRVLGLGSARPAPGVSPTLLTRTVAGEPERVSAMARVGTGDLWVFTTAGRVVPQFGTLPAPVGEAMDVVLGLDLLGPVIDAKPTVDGSGVVAMAADGGIFTYDAPFLGSVYDAIASVLGVPVGTVGPDRPVVGVTMDPDGDGYWVVASDGGVFTMRTPFRGALPAIVAFDQLVSPVNGMVPLGNGYLLVAGDGGVFNFSDQPFSGSASGLVDSSVVGIVAL